MMVLELVSALCSVEILSFGLVVLHVSSTLYSVSRITQTMNCVRPRNKNQIFLLIACITVLIVYSFALLCYNSRFTCMKPISNAFVHDLKDVKQYDQLLSEENRHFRTNILFLKTHKTGSSTVQNILLRFGMRFSLNIMLPEKDNYIAYRETLNNQMFDEKLLPVDGKFNVFTCHSTYHPSTMHFMYNDTVRVTLLRDPSSHFESIYNFYSLDQRYKLSLEEFVRSSSKVPMNLTRRSAFDKSTNQMCYDLGLVSDEINDSIIRHFVDYMDREFDFVMISEHFNECLILLADLMGWSLKYVSYLPLMIRVEGKKSNLTLEDKLRLRELNRADSLLYDHFMGKFRQQVLRYGVNLLLRDLRTFDQLNEELYAKCISGETTAGYGGTLSYTLKPNPDWECTYAAKQELAFIDEIRKKQTRRFEREKKLIDLVLN